MADINADIKVNIDTSSALSSLKLLQGQISAFQTQMAQSGAAAQAEARKLQQTLINNLNATGQFSAQLKNVASEADAFTTALEKNKMSIGQYFKYAGAASRDFGKFFGKEFDTINKVAVERVKDIQTQYIQLGKTANGAIKTIAVRPLALDMDNLSTKMQIAAQRQALMNQLLKQGSTAMLNWGKNTQWAGRQLMVGFTIPLAMAGSKAIQSFMEIEKAAIKFKRVYGDAFTTTAESNRALGEIKSLAQEFTKYGVAVKDTMDMAATAAATGKMGADLVAQVKEATKLAVLGDIDQQKALETTISLTNAFGIASQDLSKKINFLNATENQTVTTIDDLTTAIPKAAPVIQQLGGNVEDLTFFLTAMKEGGINASEGANALKSGLASMINPTGKAADMLQGFGINLKGIVEANKGDVKGLVIDFATALNKLDPLNRARAIEQLFGKFQFARISTLFKNVTNEASQANRVLKLANASSAELAVLSEREMKKISDSPMYKFQKSLQDVQAKLAPIGEKFLKLITPIINIVGKLLDKFSGFSEGTQNFIVGFTSIVGGLGPIVLMTTGLIANGIANIIKMITGVKSFLNRRREITTDLGLQTSYLTQQELEARAAAASLDQVHAKLTQTLTSEVGALRNLAIAYQDVVNKQRAYMFGAGGGATRAKMAGGGIVVGPGGPTDDLVPTDLSNGEAVIPAASVRKNPRIISALLTGRRINIPGYAQGHVTGDFHAYTNAVQYISGPINRAMGAEGANPADVLSGITPQSYAPIIAESLTHALGKLSPAQISAEIEKQPKYTEFARDLATAVAKEVADATEPITDEVYHEINSRNARELAKSEKYATNVGPNIEKTLDTVTAFEDDTVRRLTGSGANKGIGRRQLTSETPTYESATRGKMYAAAHEAMGGTAEERDGTQLSHIVARGSISASEMAQLENPTSFTSGAVNNFERGVIQVAQRDAPKGSARVEIPATATSEQIKNAALSTKAQLEASGEEVKKEVVGNVDEAIIAGKQEAQINSPSKRFAQEIGLPIVQGIADGIRQGKNLVTEAIREVTNTGKGLPTAPGLSTPPGMSPSSFVPTPDMANEVMESPTVKSGFMSGLKEKASGFAKVVGGKALDAIEQTAGKYISSKLSIPGDVVTDRRGNVLYAQDENGNDATQQAQEAQANGQTSGAIIVNGQQQSGGNPNVIASREYQMDANGNPIFSSRAERKQYEEDMKGAKRDEKRLKREAFKEKIKGRFGGGMGMMGANMAVGMLATQQGKLGDVARSVVGPMSALSAIMMMIPGPTGIVVAGIAALGAGLYGLWQSFQDAKKAGMEYGKSLLMTNDKLKSISEIYGTVSATEEKAKSTEIAIQGLSKKDKSDAATFAQSEIGKSMIAGIDQMVKAGMSTEQISTNLSNQLKIAIAEGVINDKQAAAIGQALGNKVSAAVGISVASRINREQFGKTFKENPLETSKKMYSENQNQSISQMNKMLDASNKMAQKSGALRLQAINESYNPLLGGGLISGGGIKNAFSQLIPDDWAKGIGWDKSAGYQAKQLDLKKEQTLSAVGAIALGNLQTNQQIYDSTQKQLDLQYESLKVQYESEQSSKRKKKLEEEIIQVQKDKIEAQKEFEKQNQQTMETLQNVRGSLGNDKFQGIIDQSINDMKDKADLIGKAQIELAQQAIGTAKEKDKKFGQSMELALASGQMSAASVAGLTDIGNNLNKTARVKFQASIEQIGFKEADQLYSLLTAMGADTTTIQTAIKASADDPEMIKTLSTLSDLAATGLEININAIINDPNRVKTVQQIMALPKQITKKQMKLELDNGYSGDLTKDQINLLLNSEGTINRTMLLAVETTGIDEIVRQYASKFKFNPSGMTPDQKKALEKKALEWWVAEHDYLNKLDDTTNNNKPTDKTKAYTSAIDKQIAALKKKLDALKKINEEMKKQEDFELAQAKRLNDMKQAMISGDYLKAALIREDMRNAQAQYDRDKKIKELEDQIAKLEEAKNNPPGSGKKKLTAADAQKTITNILTPNLVTPGYENASGGLLKGPGSGTSDSIFGMLKYAKGGYLPISVSAGEYVTRAASVAKYGVRMMDSINAGTYNTAEGNVYNVSMTINGGNADANDIAKMVIKELNTISSKNRTSNRVNA